MDRSGGVVRRGPLQIRTVRGEAYYVGGRELIPVVRVVSFGKAKATIGSDRIGGRGVGFVWIRPLAVLEVTPEGERRIAITDATASAVRGLLGVALAITLVSAAVRWLARRLNTNKSPL